MVFVTNYSGPHLVQVFDVNLVCFSSNFVVCKALLSREQPHTGEELELVEAW